MDKINKEIMKVIYNECTKDKTLSVSAERKATLSDIKILSMLPYNLKINEESLHEKILELATEDYYECDEKQIDTELQYTFSLLNKGKSFCNELEARKKAVKFKITLTVSGAILSFIIGVILKAIFN